jgi:hypothetical protein
MESPQSGWMSMSLKAGEEGFVMASSYQPYDSLRDLVEGLCALLKGSTDINIRWNCEPEEFDFRMRAHERDEVQCEVIRYPNHRRQPHASQIVFSLRSSKLDICLPFWRALRDLRRRISTDEFESNWRREFPHHELQQLTKLIRSVKRRVKPGKLTSTITDVETTGKTIR